MKALEAFPSFKPKLVKLAFLLEESVKSGRHITTEAFKDNFASANDKQAHNAPNELEETESLFVHRLWCANSQSKVKKQTGDK